MTLPQPLAPLHDLMLNLRWSWHPPTVELFESIDPAGWAASGGDPVAMLSLMRPGQLAALAANEDFLRRLDAAVADLRRYTGEPRWYQSGGCGRDVAALPRAIAYFSPEYGITAVLPQYSGGLGILAGDHLKSASDLGVPIIGVGLLYRHGYFTQSLSADGWQAERYPADDPNGLPLTLLRWRLRASEAGDAPVTGVSVMLAEGKLLTAQVWLAQVGRVPLLLLDSYVEANEPALHEVTDRLYGGGTEHRLRQELLLGIGGVRAVRAFCEITGHPEPEVFHTNEGHAGFLGLERIREYQGDGLSFDEALERSRAGTVFTTHTPVPAGIDRFPRELIERYFAADGANAVLPLDRVLALGAETYPGGDPHVFNMAVMGMRLAQRVNGVSVLHGEVSREMFAGLWPGFDTAEVPIGSITNGVHAPTWVAREVSELGDAQAAASADAGAAVGDPAAAARPAGHRDPAPAARVVAAARRVGRRADLDRRRARRGRADDRVRPPGALVQAADADAQRPAAARRPAARPGAAHPDRDRGQGAPGGRGRQAAHPADGQVRRLRDRAAQDRLPARLRHGARQVPRPGLRRLAEQPAAPA